MAFSDLNSSLPTPEEFYVECCKEFHDISNYYGLSSKKVVFVPELIRIGEEAVLAFLKDPFLQMHFRYDPQQYYYMVNTMSFMAGVVFGDKWHHQVAELKSGFAEEVIKKGPSDYATPIIEEVIGLDPEGANELYGGIYMRWMELHEPFWKLQDPRDYTFKLMLASYQLGVSTMLEKLGY